MGYTHYWRNTPNCTDDQWEAVKTNALKILNATDVPVNWESDSDEPPEVSDSIIRFNGVEDDGCETFLFDRNSRRLNSFNFCKTNGKPYDEVVVAMLAMLVAEIPTFQWTSDGGYPDFVDGLSLYDKAMNS